MVRQKVTENIEGRNRQTDIGVLQRRDRSTERYKLSSFRIMQIKLKLFGFISIVGKIEYDELYDEQQLIYKRTPMDFIDHLWELLSRNQRKK